MMMMMMRCVSHENNFCLYLPHENMMKNQYNTFINEKMKLLLNIYNPHKINVSEN